MNEKIKTRLKEDFEKMWNNGEFQWNYHEETVAKHDDGNLSLWRVWNNFIEPALDSAIESARIQGRREVVSHIEYCIDEYCKAPLKELNQESSTDM